MGKGRREYFSSSLICLEALCGFVHDKNGLARAIGNAIDLAALIEAVGRFADNGKTEHIRFLLGCARPQARLGIINNLVFALERQLRGADLVLPKPAEIPPVNDSVAFNPLQGTEKSGIM